MNCRNTVTLIGHVGQDCEVRTFDSGAQKATFSLATSNNYTNSKGEAITNTDWHYCESWGTQVNTMGKYFKKGRQIAVQGSLHTDSYEDKEGAKRSRTYVKVNSFTFLGKKDA